MEALGVALVVGLFGGLAFWAQYGKGKAQRQRDHARWQHEGLLDELSVATRKLKAQSQTIIALERMVVEGGGDSRALLGVISTHRRLLSEADRRDPAPADDVHPEPSDSPATEDAGGVRSGAGLLELRDGDRGSELGDARTALGRRGAEVRGGDDG